MTPGSLGNQERARCQIGGVEKKTPAALVDQSTRDSQEQYPVLGNRLGDDLRRKGIEGNGLVGL